MASSHRLDGRLAGSLSPLVFPNKPPTTRTLAHLEEKQQIAVEREERKRKKDSGEAVGEKLRIILRNK